MRRVYPWALAVLYAAIMVWLGAVRYAVHRNFVDFGIFAQTVSSAFGCFCNTIEGSHWAFHFSPILYLTGAVVWFWHSPYVLIGMQAIACALVVPPVYAVVARRASHGVAALAATVAALYPPLAGLAFNDFHENGFAPAAVAWTLWAFDAGRPILAFALALVAIAVKEDQAIFIGIAGAFAALRYPGTLRARAGVAIAVAGFAAAIAFFTVVQPHAEANPQWAPVRFYAWTGDDVAALFPRGLTDRLGFIALVFLPLLFLPFRSRLIWLAAAPLAEVLLSRMSTTYTNGSHYAGAWLGYVLIAFAVAVRSLPETRARSVLVTSIALCVVELAVANPMHPGLNLRAVQPRDRTLDVTLAGLPPDISVATQEEAYTHLALRDPYATLLPDDDRVPVAACFVLVDRDYPDSPRLQEYGAAFDSLAASGMYVRVSEAANAELYRRRSYCR